MWPWGHAAVGYLVYSAYRRYRDGTSPTGPAVVAVLFGTQVPDLVDKPLAWSLGVLPTGRSLAHSWLVAAVVLGGAWVVLHGDRRSLLVPLAVGWFSHGVADGVHAIANWEPAYLGFLLWPVTATPPSETDPSFVAHLLAFRWDGSVMVQTALFLVAVLFWYTDGRPGLDVVRAVLRGDRLRNRS